MSQDIHTYINVCVCVQGFECNCESVVIATRGGGLGPYRHDDISPLLAATTLAPTFSPNVSGNEKEWPETKIDSLEHFLRIDRRREGPKTKSGSLEHILHVDLKREGPKTKSGSLEHFLRIDVRGGGA